MCAQKTCVPPHRIVISLSICAPAVSWWQMTVIPFNFHLTIDERIRTRTQHTKSRGGAAHLIPRERARSLNDFSRLARQLTLPPAPRVHACWPGIKVVLNNCFILYTRNVAFLSHPGLNPNRTLVHDPQPIGRPTPAHCHYCSAGWLKCDRTFACAKHIHTHARTHRRRCDSDSNCGPASQRIGNPRRRRPICIILRFAPAQWVSDAKLNDFACHATPPRQRHKCVVLPARARAHLYVQSCRAPPRE